MAEIEKCRVCADEGVWAHVKHEPVCSDCQRELIGMWFGIDRDEIKVRLAIVDRLLEVSGMLARRAERG